MKNKYFTEKERYQLEVLRKNKTPVKEIARLLDKSERTIYYELNRGYTKLLDTHLRPYKIYLADVAQRKFEEKKNSKGIYYKAADNPEFINFVQNKILNEKLSPYAVSVHPDIPVKVCENTIYNYIRSGLIKNVSQENLSYIKKKQKKKKVIRYSKHKADHPSIELRSPDILDRNVYGHWEMDTVYSGRNTSKECLLVLTERMTLDEIIVRMSNRTATSTVRALDKLERSYGKELFKNTFKTITCDNGSEFSDYAGLTKHNRTKVYYCHAYSSCERGSNENQNKLIRRWIPKGDDIALYSDKEIQAIQDWINHLPRRLFNGLSSHDMVNMHKKQC